MLSSSFKLETPKKFSVVIPRVLSAVLAHLKVEPDIRAGLILMKYCLNHPEKFVPHEGKKNTDIFVNAKRVFFAFFLGFSQCIISIVIEIMIIIYLASIPSLIDIILKFAAMTSIVTFDDMYAGALYEEKMLKAVGKKLPIEYKKYMGVNYEKRQAGGENAAIQDEEDIDLDHEADIDEKCVENPRKGYCILGFARVIYKTLRIFYISVEYYFLPFLAVALNLGSLPT